MSLAPSDIAYLRRLHEAATPGPWLRDNSTVYTIDHATRSNRTHAQFSGARGVSEDELVANAALIVAARNALPALLAAAEERDELQSVFASRWEADRRAIARWQEATGRKRTWPDHADMVVWLLGEVDRLTRERDEARERADDRRWFWRIVDRDGLGNVPSDEDGALALLVRRATRTEAAEAEVARLREVLRNIRDLTPQAANTVSADGHHEATASIARAALARLKETTDAAE